MNDINKLRNKAKELGINNIPSTNEPGIALAGYLLNLEARIKVLEKQFDAHINDKFKIDSGINNIDKINEALNIAMQYGAIDEAHHKAWVIDQMVRVLVGEKYNDFVAVHNNGEDGLNSYTWDTGIAP